MIYICGLAIVDVLNTYQDDKLILSPYLRKKGTKTGFYGFSSLIPLADVKDINELSKYCYTFSYNEFYQRRKNEYKGNEIYRFIRWNRWI